MESLENFSFYSFQSITIRGKYLEILPKDEEESEKFIDLVLIHAFPFDSGMYYPNFEDKSFIDRLQNLANKKGSIRIILVDSPGFGGSDKLYIPPEDLSQYVDIVAEVKNEFEIENFILGGCSMGGYITLEYMNRFQDFLDGIILIDTKTASDEEAKKQDRLKTASMIEKILSQYDKSKEVKLKLDDLYLKHPEIKDFIDGMYSKITYNKAIQSNPEIGEEVLNIMKRQPAKGVIDALRGMAGRADTSQALSRFSGKTLVMIGDNDSLISEEIAKKMAIDAQDSEFAVIKCAGHLSNIDNVKDFNEKLYKWIESF